jgi:SAM-dependent methyltransferase
LFAVMSDAEFRNSDTNFSPEQLTAFYEQGRRFWNRWLRSLLWDRPPDTRQSILEYGCGMGRILNQAPLEGLDAFGVDISRSQVDMARTYCPQASMIDFMVLDEAGKIPRENGSFDIVYSYAVLQHIKSTSSLDKAIGEICRVTKPGGLVRVQVRSHHAFLSRNVYRWFSALNFEHASICFYLRKIGFIYVPVVRLNKHTNWVGACANHSVGKLLGKFDLNGVAIQQIEFDSANKLVWFTGRRS